MKWASSSIMQRLAISSLSLLGLFASAYGFVLTTPYEHYGVGDFDGDGLPDLLIVNKPEGRYRIGYGKPDGSIEWVPHRKSGVKGVTGVAIGCLLRENRDAVAFVGGEENVLVVIDLSDRQNPAVPIPVDLQCMGPTTGAGIDIGGNGNNRLQDLLVASTFNLGSDVPTRLSLYRSTGQTFEHLSEVDDPEGALDLPIVWRPTSQTELLVGLWRKEGGDTRLRIVDLSTGRPKQLAVMEGLSERVKLAVADERAPSISILVYESGKPTAQLLTASLEGNTCHIEPRGSVSLPESPRYLVGLGTSGSTSLWAFVSQDEQTLFIVSIEEQGRLSERKRLQAKPGDKFFGIIGYRNALFVATGEDFYRDSRRYFIVRPGDGGQWFASAEQELPSLKEDDRWTIPLIYQRLVQTLEREGIRSAADMKPYTNTIPGTRVQYVMVPVPGGEFFMGSPENEPGRCSDEGPRHKVYVDPFWIGKFEVTWNEYDLFVYHEDEQKIRMEVGGSDKEADQLADGVAHPTKPYAEMSFGMGKDGYPAIAMTQHAANKYCQWLSAKTGHFYRLPTEAEWEYACRAGTTTAYSFGDDVSQLGEYAWYEENSDFKYHKVGTKKPNPWGIHDMHGNVWEWCLDQYLPDYTSIIDQPNNPYVRPTKPYPIVVRGGSYDDSAEKCRSAARRASDPSWKMRDPQLPKSIWWLTDAPWVGFRLVRPLKLPPQEEIYKYWYNEVEYDQ